MYLRPTVISALQFAFNCVSGDTMRATPSVAAYLSNLSFCVLYRGDIINWTVTYVITIIILYDPCALRVLSSYYILWRIYKYIVYNFDYPIIIISLLLNTYNTIV